jgi:ABC-type bacteriocin/lantibiotic exporter with double-glycine peptidase domain
MPRFVCVEQYSEEDCGAACVATIARYYGKSLPLPVVREAVGTGVNGTTLLGLRRGADALGFNCRAVRAEKKEEIFQDLSRIELPAIVHWRGDHWVVFYGVYRNKAVIADPAVGIRRLSRQEFLDDWTNGVLLLLDPDNLRLNSQPDDPKIRNGYRRLLKYILPFSSLILNALLINIVIGLVALGMPIVMQLLTDDVLVRRDSGFLGTLAIGMVILIGFRSILDYFQSNMFGYFTERMELNIVLLYGRKLLQMPMSYFESHRSGEILSRVSDIGRINNLLSFLVVGLPSQLFISIVSLVVMLFYSVPLTVVAIVLFVIILAVDVSFLPAIRDKSRRVIVRNAENQGFLVEMFRGAQVLKTTDATPQAWEEYQGNFGALSRLSWQSLKLTVASDTINEMLSAFVHLALLIYGSTFVLNNQLSIGQLLAFNGMSMNVLNFLTEFANFAATYINGNLIFGRLSEVLDAKPEQNNDIKKVWIDLPANLPIKCKKVSFSHPGRVELIRSLNLEIPGGQTTALIGESGCGKSTMAKILSGLCVPQKGIVQFGPYGQKDIALDCLRQQVCLVPQDTQFFNRSILENFKFSYPKIDYQQIVEACQLCLAHEFICELPDGYHTVLGEFGANLSGGQKQRLAIARALVARPSVLILDESTSAMDPVLEGKFLANLFEHRRGCTTILISHRPNLILQCDWVIYLERGGVKFQGKPSDMKQQKSLSRFILQS